VLISTVQWAALTEVIADARGALAGIEDRLKDGEDAVASLLLWHYFHRKDSGHLTTSTYWHGVAKKIIDGLTDGFEEKT
jgi:hypothetical protein